MPKKSLIILCSIFVALVAGSALIRVAPSSTVASPRCRWTALDVGQGDSILIQTADGQDILVDGGPSADVVTTLSQHLGPGDRDLELVVLTHPDADHLTGLVSIVQRFPVHQILVSDNPTNTATYRAWQNILAENHLPVRTVTQGEAYEIGDSTHLNVLWPPAGWKERFPKTPTNDLSVSLYITCAGSTVVMTGDGSEAMEGEILRSGLNVSATLLKVGHHGSRTSSSHEFLQAVRPALAVISVGAKNRYHHPHPATLERFNVMGIRVLRTDQLGDVELESDGRGGWREKP